MIQRFHGSRNFVDEHVSNFIWEDPPGTVIVIRIVEKDRCEVERFKNKSYQEPSQNETHNDDIDSRRTPEEKRASEELVRQKLKTDLRFKR